MARDELDRENGLKLPRRGNLPLPVRDLPCVLSVAPCCSVGLKCSIKAEMRGKNIP